MVIFYMARDRAKMSAVKNKHAGIEERIHEAVYVRYLRLYL